MINVETWFQPFLNVETTLRAHWAVSTIDSFPFCYKRMNTEQVTILTNWFVNVVNKKYIFLFFLKKRIDRVRFPLILRFNHFNILFLSWWFDTVYLTRQLSVDLSPIIQQLVDSCLMIWQSVFDTPIKKMSTSINGIQSCFGISDLNIYIYLCVDLNII